MTDRADHGARTRTRRTPPRLLSGGVAAGVIRDIDACLVAHNMLLTAHSWALKHWNLSTWLTLDQFIDQ